MNRLIFTLWLFGLGTAAAYSQACGLQDTLIFGANTSPSYNFLVSNLFNDDLSDPDQGVCGVEIEFVHQFIDRLELALISPAGQVVELIGPNTNEQFPSTFAARWDIEFVPCGAAAMPDPGSLPQWSNTQMGNFVNGGQYEGSYYPFNGCLEDFDTGPANGTWTIAVTNAPSQYAGGITGFRIIFCDERGLDCCFADAGQLLQEDRLACEGDSSLIFQPAPSYSDDPPDTPDYGYTYLIGEDSILVDIDSTLDLTGLVPGRYQVCGFSYQRNDQDSIPMPNDSLTIDSLRRNLGGFDPAFCGDVSDSCIWIDIVAPPTPTNLQETICQGDSIVVGDSTFTESGSYQLQLNSFAGCDSTVSLELEVITSLFTEIDTTICAGQAFAMGGNLYDSSGTYTDTLPSSQLCDSIITLELQVLDTAFFDTTLTICQGETFAVGDSLLDSSGFYEIGLPSAQGCDSIVRVGLSVLDIDAQIAPPDAITCGAPQVLLDGTASAPAPSLSYRWLDEDGNTLGNSPTQSVGIAGSYILEVERIENGQSCLARDTVDVAIDTLPPTADAGLPATITCTDTVLALGGNGTSTGPSIAYEWSSPDGSFLGPVFDATVEVDAPGTYTLAATNIDNRCSDSSEVVVSIDQNLPFVDPGQDTSLNCLRDSLQLNGTASSAGPDFLYQWKGPSGSLPGGGPTPTVSEAGNYQLIITDNSNGCVDSAEVEVGLDTLAPKVNLLPPDTLNCQQTTLSLQATASDIGTAPVYLWQTTGGNILSGSSSLSPTIDAPGSYLLVAQRQENGCRDSAAVQVEEDLSDVNAQIAPPETLSCLNSTVTLDGSASTAGPAIVYDWSTENGQLQGGTANATASAVSTGTYQLVVLDSLTFCADTAVATIVADTLPPAADAGPNRTITCDSSSVTLDGSGSSQGSNLDYDWVKVEDTQLVAVDDLFPAVNEAGTYLLVVTDATNGCFDSALVQVEVDTLSPTAQLATPDTLNCSLNSTTLDGTGSTSGPGFSFSWAAGTGGQITAGQNTLMPTVAAAGLYTLQVENDSTGCRALASVEVADTLSSPQASIMASDTLSCLVEEATLSADSSSNEADVVYQWSTLNGEISGDSTAQSITVPAPGQYQLLALDTFTRCADTAFLNMPLDTIAPTAEAGDGFELNCSTLEGTLSGLGSSTGNTFTYAWAGPCLLSGSDSLQATVDCPGTYRLEVQDTTNGCTASDSVIVTQDASTPVAAIAGPYRLTCDSLTRTLDATASSQGPGLVYSWAGPGLLSGADGLTPVVGQAGAYTLTVEDTINTCQATATVNVSLDTLSPEANAGIVEIINCDSATVQIGGIESSMGPAFTYQWSGPAGGFIGADDAAFAEVGLPGNYTIVVTDSTNGCSASSTTTVFLDTLPPAADAGPDLELSCSKPVVVLDGTNSPSGANILYEWSGPCLLSSPEAPQAEVNCEGAYVLQLLNTNSGCRGSDTVQVSRDPLLPNAVLPDSLALSCEAGTVVIDATPSEGEVFEWLLDGAPTILSGLSPTVDSPGLYTLIADNTAQDCADTATVAVTLDCPVTAEIAAPDTLSCAQTSISLSASVSAPGTALEYQWLPPAPNCISGDTTALQATVRCPGLYTFVATNTISGESDSVSVEVFLDDTPPLAEAGDPVLLTCDAPTNTLDASGSSVGDQFGYVWTKLDDDAFVKDSFSIQVDDDGTFFLTVIDSLNGCTAEDVVSVQRSDEQQDIAFSSLVIPCLQDSFWVTSFVTPEGPAYEYSWSGDMILGATDSSSVLVDTSGSLQLSVVNPINNCLAQRTVEVRQQDCIPCLEAMPADSFTCLVDTVQLQAAFCDDCPGCTLEWSGPVAGLVGPTDQLEATAVRPGLYTLKATDTLGFSSTLDLFVTENTTPPSVEAGAAQVQLTCSAPTAVLGSGQANRPEWRYQWFSAGAGLLPNDTLPQLSVSTADTFRLRIVDRITGCSAEDQVAVQYDTIRPTAEAGVAPLLSCTEATVTLDGSGSSFGTDIVYQWTGPADANIAGANTFNPVVDSPGWYTLLVTDSTSGCSELDSVRVEQSIAPPPLPALSDTVLNCNQPEVNLLGALPGGGNYSSCWYVLNEEGEPAGPCIPQLSLEVDEAGRYRFEVRDEETGCTSQADLTVSADFAAPAVMLADTLVLNCNPNSLLIEAELAGPGNDFFYEWEGPAGADVSGVNAPSLTVNLPGDYQLKVRKGENGCDTTLSTVVLPNENIPELQMGPDTSLNCERTSLRLSAEYDTESGAANLQWEAAPGQIVSGANTANPLIDAPGLYQLRLTDPQSGCQAMDSLRVVDAALAPEAAVEPSPLQLDCRTDSLLLDASPSSSGSGGGIALEWRRGGFEPIGQGSQQWITEPGNYRLLVTDSLSNCLDTLLFSVSADYQQPQAAIAEPPLLSCERDTLRLDPSSSDAGPGFSFEWSGPDGVLPAAPFDLLATEPGTYTITILDESNGCSAQASVEVESDGTLPEAIIQPPRELNCDRTSVLLDGSASSQGNAITYKWSTSGEGALFGPNDGPRAAAGAPAWYTLQVIDTENGCTQTDSVEVLQSAELIASAQWSITPPSCLGQADGQIALDRVLGGTAPFFLSLENGPFTESDVLDGLAPGEYQVRIEDANGCEWDGSLSVPEGSSPSVSLGPESSIRLGGRDTLFATVDPPEIDSVWWWPADGVQLSPLSYEVAPERTTLYRVWVMDEEGCIGTAQTNVKVLEELPVYAPNVFSPNGDEQNDVFLIYAGSEVERIERFRIYDRWGDLVHEAIDFAPNDPAFGWDGQLRGYEMDSAVFVYYAEIRMADGRVEVVKGDFVLMR